MEAHAAVRAGARGQPDAQGALGLPVPVTESQSCQHHSTKALITKDMKHTADYSNGQFLPCHLLSVLGLLLVLGRQLLAHVVGGQGLRCVMRGQGGLLLRSQVVVMVVMMVVVLCRDAALCHVMIRVHPACLRQIHWVRQLHLQLRKQQYVSPQYAGTCLALATACINPSHPEQDTCMSRDDDCTGGQESWALICKGGGPNTNLLDVLEDGHSAVQMSMQASLGSHARFTSRLLLHAI